MKRWSRSVNWEPYCYHPKMPAVNAEAQRRVLTFVDHPYKYFRDLALPTGHVKTTYIQRRCAIATYLCTLLACMCQRTRRIGYPVPGSDPPRFRCYNARQLIKRSSNMHQRRWQRVAAATRGYVRVNPRSKAAEAEGIVGFAAVRRIEENLWHRIGLHKQWVAACDEADKLLRSGAGDETATAELIKDRVMVRRAVPVRKLEETIAERNARYHQMNRAMMYKLDNPPDTS